MPIEARSNDKLPASFYGNDIQTALTKELVTDLSDLPTVSSCAVSSNVLVDLDEVLICLIDHFITYYSFGHAIV